MAESSSLWRTVAHKAFARWAEREEDFSLARALEPLFTNKGIIAYVAPVPLLGFINQFLSADHFDAAILILCFWCFGGVLLGAGLSLRWYMRAAGVRTEVEHLNRSRERLAVALAEGHRRNPRYFTILDWDELATTNDDLVTTIVRSVRIMVGPEPMDVFWSDCESYGPLVAPESIDVSAFRKQENNRKEELEADTIWTQKAGKLTFLRLPTFPDDRACGQHAHAHRVLEVAAVLRAAGRPATRGTDALQVQPSV